MDDHFGFLFSFSFSVFRKLSNNFVFLVSHVNKTPSMLFSVLSLASIILYFSLASIHAVTWNGYFFIWSLIYTYFFQFSIRLIKILNQLVNLLFQLLAFSYRLLYSYQFSFSFDSLFFYRKIIRKLMVTNTFALEVRFPTIWVAPSHRQFFCQIP